MIGVYKAAQPVAWLWWRTYETNVLASVRCDWLCVCGRTGGAARPVCLAATSSTAPFTPRLLIEDEFPPVDRNDRALAAAKNERELRLDVQRLYAIASELKDEANGNNSQLVLNVTVVRRVQAIEKLAKQIKDRAKR